MLRQVIQTDQAPQAIGAYSQAIVYDDRLVFSAGQIGLDPRSGQLVAGGVAAQTERAMENLKAILAAAGSSLDKVLKVTIFLADIDDFAVVNEIYGRYFTEEPPVRSALQVAALPKGARVEIECIAMMHPSSAHR